MRSPSYYFVSECGAKFFHHAQDVACPRCGEQLHSEEEVEPPWRTYDVRSAALMLGISRSKLYELVERQRITHRRIGGSIRFTTDDLAEFLEEVKEAKREREKPACKQKPSRPRLRNFSL